MKKRMLITAIVAVVVIIGALALASCAEVSTSVTYMSDGEVFKTVTVEGTEAADPAPAPEKTGYTFGGWFADEACQTPFDFKAYVANEERADITVYAKWNINTYSAKFVADGKTVQEVQFNAGKTSVTAPAVPQRVGYEGKWEEYELKSEDITINAVYTPITYNITYENTKGAANSNPATYNIETATITLADIASPGYIFEGWFVGEEKVESIELGSYGDITLTAKWSPITYNITYENTKGAANSNPATYNIETEITLADIASPGYTFEGWFVGEEKVESIELGSYGDIALTAKWSPTTYNITYENTKGAANSNPATYNIETETITLAGLASPGYTFEGWFVGEEKVESIELGSYGDITLTAKLSPITYNITYEDTKGAANSNPAIYNIETEITLTDIASPGYTFEGWFVGEEKVESIELGSYGDITLTAKWTIAEYSVNYVLNGGTNKSANPSSYSVDTLGGTDGVIPLEDPFMNDFSANSDGTITYNAYEFLGWYKDSGFEQQVSELSLSVGSVTLYAKWSATPTEDIVNYVRVNENNERDENGNYILFGQYPQTIKAADVTITSDTLDEDGYYLGSDGERYAKVVAEPYKSGYTFSDNSSVISGNTYYFKVEPIRWRILSVSNGKAYILCDSVIANKAYDAGRNNNYARSDIRAWLNNEFYNSAFGDLQRALIQTTEVDNSAASTETSSNPYVCENTLDKVFLLGYREVALEVRERCMLASDYSRATGVDMKLGSIYYGNGSWWLRTPYYYGATEARIVNSMGSPANSRYVNYGGGVVPALNLTL